MMTFREYILMSADDDMRGFIVKNGCSFFLDAADLLRHMHIFHRSFIFDARIERYWSEYARQTPNQVFV